MLNSTSRHEEHPRGISCFRADTHDTWVTSYLVVNAGLYAKLCCEEGGIDEAGLRLAILGILEQSLHNRGKHYLAPKLPIQPHDRVGRTSQRINT